MQYKNIRNGIFYDRPNRFIANVEINGKMEVCHVKNTGRCKELLPKGAKVILEKSDNSNRKTDYDLVAVYKENKLINMDSMAPNKVFLEWLGNTDFFGKITYIKPEKVYGNSRFDFYIETETRKIFIEVKGVTLEERGVVMFPDAPTDRGVKHLCELIDAKNEGYDSYVFFVIQMENCLYFTPNIKTDKEFANALKKAVNEGVKALAVNCKVTENSLKINKFVDIKM